MSTERDYQELYDRLLEEVGALHRANQRRIRNGMWTLLAVTVGLMLLMFLADGNKVFTLVLWIVSMFGVAAYLIAVEYMDYELQKKLRTITKMKEDAFGRLMNVPELPAVPELPHVARRLRRSALPETTAPAEDSAPAEDPAPAASSVPTDEPAPAEPAPAEPPVPEAPAAEEQPAPAPQPTADAAPRYVPLPSGWEHALEDPAKLADDLALLTRALQNLSDDLRRGAGSKEVDR